MLLKLMLALFTNATLKIKASYLSLHRSIRDKISKGIILSRFFANSKEMQLYLSLRGNSSEDDQLINQLINGFKKYPVCNLMCQKGLTEPGKCSSRPRLGIRKNCEGRIFEYREVSLPELCQFCLT